jgi:hypothetical protein
VAIALDTLAYARRLREAGFSGRQAEGQAEALAAAMTDTPPTKQDLSELRAEMGARLREFEARMEGRFAQADTRCEYLEKHMDTRFAEQSAVFTGRMADLERRMAMRLGGVIVAAIGAVSALVRLL